MVLLLQRASGPIVEAALATNYQISHIAVNVQRIIIIFSMILPCHVSKIVSAHAYKLLKKITSPLVDIKFYLLVSVWILMILCLRFALLLFFTRFNFRGQVHCLCNCSRTVEPWFLTFICTLVDPMHCLQDPQISLFSNFFIKNGSPVLFTYLKIILLQYFQFLVISKRTLSSSKTYFIYFTTLLYKTLIVLFQRSTH